MLGVVGSRTSALAKKVTTEGLSLRGYWLGVKQSKTTVRHGNYGANLHES